jgi:hypothetical protein
LRPWQGNLPDNNSAICWKHRVSGGTRSCHSPSIGFAACSVTIRPVRSISRKGLIRQAGWIESLATWATGLQDSSTEKGASTSRSVERKTEGCRGGFPLRTPKVGDLAIFRRITSLVRSGRHLTIAGFEEILELRAPMNRGGKRRRCDEELIATLRSWESSEAIRRAPSLKPADEDMVRPS